MKIDINRLIVFPGNSSRSLLPLNVRRMNIIHHDTLNHEQNKTARKVQSFLTAVKEMFKEPESAEDILAWEAWGPCSRTCGEGAVRTRQRKCEKLVARDFDVACPEPRKQTEKCPVVSCSGKVLLHQWNPLKILGRSSLIYPLLLQERKTLVFHKKV